MLIDARGKACPMPVIMAKKELDRGERALTVAVDNAMALENLRRLAISFNTTFSSEEKDGDFFASFGAKADTSLCPPRATDDIDSGCAVFIARDAVGSGERALGESLMKMALYTLAQSDNIPGCILFMNSGVKLPAGEEQQLTDSISALIKRGTEVLVCGTCLNFYGLTDKLKCGAVSNMYDMMERMLAAKKVISL